MAKKKTRKTTRPVMTFETPVSPEIRSLMRRLGLTDEEALRMMRECNAAIHGVHGPKRQS